ncbi:MAG: putative sugar transferase EpsL [Chromatiales bacterium USCg_Taylor]|nr:MAG: putative sugar transferase EpsL [Chromatiales bacterium USCg_Taylor]
MDVTGASLGLVLTALPMLVIALAIRITMGTPVLFRQMRPGFQGLPFEILKFRTMRCPAGGLDELDEARLTPLGRFLRSLSLDELPELWNVLKGDLSLVGPRPLLMEYLNLYSPEQARRQEVKPGITGWAQVNGRNALGWPERFELDVWYVDHQSLRLDVKILLLSVGAMLRRKGINAEGHATMPPFRGNNAGG